MRPLIRPLLFIVARLGLFLAVVAWVVGQWSCVFVYSGYFQFEWDGTGVVAKHFDSSAFSPFDSLSVESIPVDPNGNYEWVSEKLPPVDGISEFAIRHWQIISIFAIFNLILHFHYRKRPETEVRET